MAQYFHTFLLFLISFSSILSSPSHEFLFLQNLKQYISIDTQTFETLASHVNETFSSHSFHPTLIDTLPLFNYYPSLLQDLAHVSLGLFPTPIEKLGMIGEQLHLQNLYIKRDDLCGGYDQQCNKLFGGNKVRKLEFLMADAMDLGAQSVLTFGCIGSNHVVATAAYAQSLGLRCYAMLKPQPDSEIVRRNVRLMQFYGALLTISSDSSERVENTIQTFMASKEIYGDYPYFIPTGGSNKIGAIGFVNAAFELREQIKQGILPEPDYIYIAAGSFGTTVGLSLGLRAAGLKTMIRAIGVEPVEPAYIQCTIDCLFKEINHLLHKHDSTFPFFEQQATNVELVYDFSGTAYGLSTKESAEAFETVQQLEGIQLDGTYTAKAFAALLNDAREGRLTDKVVLFWHTFCGDSNCAILYKNND